MNPQIETPINYRKLIIPIGILIVLNTLLFGLLIKGSRTTAGNFLAALNANLLGFNALGFVIGTIVTLFPYKKLTYRKKYLRASLISILSLQIIMGVGLLLLGIFTLVGWY